MKLKIASFLIWIPLIIVVSCGEKIAMQHIERLKSDDREVRLDAGYQLLVIGKPAVKPLIQVVQGNAERSRFIAAQLLGKIGDLRAVEPLIALLTSDNVHFREVIVDALGKFADERCVQPLVDLLYDDPAPSVRAKAAKALGILRYIETEEPLIDALQDSCAVVRKMALVGLDCFRDSRLNSTYLEMTRDHDAEVRYVAVQILRSSKFHDALSRFIELLHDHVPEVRQEAANALGDLGDKKAVNPLLNMLSKYYDNDTDRKTAQSNLIKITGAEYRIFE